LEEKSDLGSWHKLPLPVDKHLFWQDLRLDVERRSRAVDLQQFVRETLTEIVLGVNAAQDQAEVEASGARINPTGIGLVATPDGYLGNLSSGEAVFVVDFDLAVTVSGTGPGELAAKVQVVGQFTAKVNGTKKSARDSTNRIKFRIPVALRPSPVADPAHETNERKEDDLIERWNRTEP
jgi:hypothetical protein